LLDRAARPPYHSRTRLRVPRPATPPDTPGEHPSRTAFTLPLRLAAARVRRVALRARS